MNAVGQELRAGLSAAKRQICGALQNDFHTPKALSHLMDLVALTNAKMRSSSLGGNEETRVAPEMVWSAATFISDTLCTLGFQTVSLKDVRKSVVEHQVNVDEIVDEFVHFRSDTKLLALNALKSQKEWRKRQKNARHQLEQEMKEEMPNEKLGSESEPILDPTELMKMCDHVRDDVFQKLGLSVQDLKGGEGSQWHWTRK